MQPASLSHKFANISKHSVISRLFSIRWGLFAIFVSAVVGSCVLCFSVESTYQATAVVKLPVPIAVTNKKLLNFATDLLADRGVVVGHHSTVTVKQVSRHPLVLDITATSDSVDHVRRLANAAAMVATTQDMPLWNRVLDLDDSDIDDLIISYGMPHIAHHAIVLRDQSDIPVFQTNIRWQDSNEPYAAIWLAFLGIFAGYAYATAPVGNAISKARQARRQIIANLKLQFSPIANANINVPDSDDLKVIAGIELVPDLTKSDSDGLPKITPILLDISSDLWTVALDSTNGQEVVFVRSREAAVGSRAAVLAIGRAFSKRGMKVVMVDADLTASLSKRDEFGFPDNAPGLLDILTRSASLSTCLMEEEEYPGLSALSAGIGDLTDGAADILIESATMLDLLDYLGERNDVVLIHGPCGLDVGAAALGKRAGATIIVGPEERTTLDIKAEARSLMNLASAQANIIGRIEISLQTIPSTQIAI
jgi:Mrp family chromosome partitioning ATPase